MRGWDGWGRDASLRCTSAGGVLRRPLQLSEPTLKKPMSPKNSNDRKSLYFHFLLVARQGAID